MIEMKFSSECILCKKFHKCKTRKWKLRCFEEGRSKQKYPCAKCKAKSKDGGSCCSSCKPWWAWVLGEYGWDAHMESLRKAGEKNGGLFRQE